MVYGTWYMVTWYMGTWDMGHGHMGTWDMGAKRTTWHHDTMMFHLVVQDLSRAMTNDIESPVMWARPRGPGPMVPRAWPKWVSA